ncbi:MAG: RidA family protein [Bacteroidales bacterium]|jgi:2-iminobutanoate/2-iminopropanoate deaminase|nr:RidA family protein [Bacteroidales bacterium]MBO7321066.1 RidA family protein [Bacteroidales bacterium]MBO7764633.1 RidA family protein [Bacteroidales bacterium]MBQ2243609.1 RidA family protein [Bacteroidales bacterium]MBR5610535.1 RidA family protein [Bacteroidales bacterium]
MSKRVIASPLAPKAVGPYSQAVEANGTLYVSGQLPIDAQTGEFPEGGVKEQLVQIFKNLQYILEEAGYSFDNVVKTTVYLTNMGDFATLNEVYSQFYREPYPARVAYAVAALPKGALAEVDVIAVK